MKIATPWALAGACGVGAWRRLPQTADMNDMPTLSQIVQTVSPTGRRLGSSRLLRAAVVLAVVIMPAAGRADDEAATQAERMAALGLIRYRSGWRTPQEIELIERDEASAVASKQWHAKLARLRQKLEQPATADRAAEEIREISDPLAVAALAASLASEPVLAVRRWYVEAVSHIRTPAAVELLIAVARDHPDPETRCAAVERLLVIGPHQAVPPLVAALSSRDNAQVNRAAEALGGLGLPVAIGPLIAALQTRHVVVAGSEQPAGSTSATFTPTGGGLAMWGGPKPQVVAVRNDRVLEALVVLSGVNFEWNADAWRAWLINEQALPADFDTRRG